RTHQHEQCKAGRHEFADQLVNQQKQILEPDIDIEFAFAQLTVPEMIGDFSHAYLPWTCREHIDQDLEAGSRKVSSDQVKEPSVKHKKTAHGVGDVAAAYGTTDPCAQLAEPYAMPGEIAHAATLDIPAGHDDVAVVLAKEPVHLGKDALVM